MTDTKITILLYFYNKIINERGKITNRQLQEHFRKAGDCTSHVQSS